MGVLRAGGRRGRTRVAALVVATALALTYLYLVVWINLRVDASEEIMISNFRRFASSKECYLDLESKKQHWIDEWLDQDAPLLDAVLKRKEADSRNQTVYLISIIVKHLMHEKQYWNDAVWFCNSEENPGRLVVSNTPVHLVECSLNDPKETLHTIWPSYEQIKKYGMVAEFVRCHDLQRREDSVYLLRKHHQTSSLLTGCTIVRGVGDHIPQWIEFHKLMGFDYFWIFVNEAFPEKEWIQRPYVKYIPYNFFWDDHKTHYTTYQKPKTNIFWQEAMQMQCLYHAKLFPAIEWLTTTDVDEYIWINDTAYSAEKAAPLKSFLVDHREHNRHLAGQVMNSVFFGRHPTKDSFTLPNNKAPGEASDRPWLMDYVYRHSNPKWQRFKVIYQPNNALVAEVHSVKEGESRRLKQVYFQHYKNADRGVAKTPSVNDLIADTRLRDGYRGLVWNALQKNFNKTWV